MSWVTCRSLFPMRRDSDVDLPVKPKAQQFADYWRERLWSTPFDHADPVHFRPSMDEIKELAVREPDPNVKSPAK